MSTGNFEEQPELFGDYKDSRKQPKFFKRNIFSAQSLILNISYEKAVFVVVIIVMIILGSFSLGVERGKILAKNPVGDTKKIAPIKKNPLSSVSSEVSGEKYTIQLNTYSNDRDAQKEVVFLRSKGYKDAFVLKSSQGYKLCLGLFDSPQKAEPTLLKVKPRYKDSFIRKR